MLCNCATLHEELRHQTLSADGCLPEWKGNVRTVMGARKRTISGSCGFYLLCRWGFWTWTLSLSCAQLTAKPMNALKAILLIPLRMRKSTHVVALLSPPWLHPAPGSHVSVWWPGELCKRAHGPKQPRAEAAIQLGKLPEDFKTSLCNTWCLQGRCDYGDQCSAAHGITDMRYIIRS